jgi:tetratricopeptide (TPR) repeat protein
MELMQVEQAEQEFELARQALKEEDCEAALIHLEKALELSDNPSWYSYAGYCIGKGRGEMKTAIGLCLTAIEEEPENPVHYLNLGKVYLAFGDKDKALRTLREGMAKGGSAEIMAMLMEFGVRNPPFFPSLKRSHPLNKLIGRFLHRRALRRRGVP